MAAPAGSELMEMLGESGMIWGIETQPPRIQVRPIRNVIVDRAVNDLFMALGILRSE